MICEAASCSSGLWDKSSFRLLPDSSAPEPPGTTPPPNRLYLLWPSWSPPFLLPVGLPQADFQPLFLRKQQSHVASSILSPSLPPACDSLLSAPSAQGL